LVHYEVSRVVVLMSKHNRKSIFLALKMCDFFCLAKKCAFHRESFKKRKASAFPSITITIINGLLYVIAIGGALLEGFELIVALASAQTKNSY